MTLVQALRQEGKSFKPCVISVRGRSVSPVAHPTDAQMSPTCDWEIQGGLSELAWWLT